MGRKEELIERLKGIIQDNNFLESLPGQKFREWWSEYLTDVTAVISVAGRSRTGECFRLPGLGSESDGQMYVSHLVLKSNGQVRVQLSSEDTDEFALILPISLEPTVPIENFDEEYLQEWVDLLTY